MARIKKQKSQKQLLSRPKSKSVPNSPTSKKTAAGKKPAALKKPDEQKNPTTLKRAGFDQISKRRARGISGESSSAAKGTASTGNPFHSLRFAGVSLGGGKTDKTVVAILEYYPDRKRVFLRTLRDKLGSGGQGADQQLHLMLTEEENHLSSITFDAPLQMPKCIRCDLACPGMERCKLPEIKWMWDVHNKRSKHKRPNKMFTPYTERCCEIHIANELEEPFHPSHALGSNAAPLTARVHYLVRRLDVPVYEAFPKLTLWRIGLSLLMPKSYLRFHKHAVDSDEARLYILKTLMDKEIAFIYQQDLKILVENGQAFDAFLCALNGFLKHRGQTELPPAGFPKGESWIDFPKANLVWF